MKEGEECAVAQHLLVTADRYNLEKLKLICEDKQCKYIELLIRAPPQPSWL
jgi:speckle-type POZ protein